MLSPIATPSPRINAILAAMPSQRVEPTIKSNLQPATESVNTWVNKGVTSEEQQHINTCFLKFPDAIKEVVWEQYCLIHNSLGSASANLFIATLDDKKWSKQHFSTTKDRLAKLTKAAIDAASNTRAALKAGRAILSRKH